MNYKAAFLNFKRNIWGSGQSTVFRVGAWVAAFTAYGAYSHYRDQLFTPSITAAPVSHTPEKKIKNKNKNKDESSA